MNTKRMLHREGEDGKSIEVELLGLPPVALDMQNPPRYMKWWDALIEAIEAVQGVGIWTPSRPNTDLARTLHSGVKSVIQTLSGQKPRELMFFPTNDSVFDLYHGVDAVFILDRTWIVTIDISVRPGKKYKADVFINPSLLIDDDYLHEKVSGIAKRLLRKKRRRPDLQPLSI